MVLAQVKRLTHLVIISALLILSLSVSTLAQDVDSGSISGSTSPDDYSRNRRKPPSTPERRAEFARKQFRKYRDASKQNARKRNNLLFNKNVTLLPSGEVNIPAANNLSLMSLETDYESELNFFASKGVLLIADDFLEARFIEQKLRPNFNINAHVLLEGLLLKGNSFKKTLTATYNVPSAAAESAVSSGREIVKSMK